MGMNCGYMHVLVDHDLVALAFVIYRAVAFAADGSVTVLVDNSIHFDYASPPEVNKKRKFPLNRMFSMYELTQLLITKF